MKLLVWSDGRVVDASEFRLSSPFVLQRIHTLGYKAFNVAQHIDIMRRASVELFGFASLCRAEDAERIIEQLTRLSRVSPNLSCTVAMRLSSVGELSFEVEQPSYYSGTALSVKRPKGVFFTASQPEEISQNSVTIALDAMYDARVQDRGDIAVLVDFRKEIISRPWLPIFAVYHNVVYTPAAYDTVEYILVRDAIKSAGIELVIRSIPMDSLLRMDEVFVADTMGLTSLSSIKESRLLSVVATLIANRMEPKL
jgi:branched-subunit amino acid aminotransferase/4-amino-4-deoxychorismate lyase